MEVPKDTGQGKKRGGSEASSANILQEMSRRQRRRPEQGGATSTDAPRPPHKRPKIDITGLQPTSAHLEAGILYDRSYSEKGGMERMRRERSRQAELAQELHAMKNRGTPEQKAALQALRAQQDVPIELSINIKGVQPTLAHLEAETLHTRSYSEKGGMERMLKERPEQGKLAQEINAMIQRGSPEQKAAIQALRAQRASQRARREMAQIDNEPMAPQHQEQDEMSPREMARVAQQSYQIYIESYQRGGEEGLRQMQQHYPASYETAVLYMQQMREQRER